MYTLIKNSDKRKQQNPQKLRRGIIDKKSGENTDESKSKN